MKTEKIQKRIIKGAGFAFVGSVSFAGMKYLQRLVLARILEPEQYGVFSLGLMVFMVSVSLGALGVQRGVNRFVPYYGAKDRQDLVKGTLIGGGAIALLSGLVFAGGLFGLAEFLSLSVFNEPDLVGVVRLLCFAIPATILLRVLIRALEGFKKVNYSMGVKNGEIFLRFFGILAVLLGGFGLLVVSGVFVFSAWLVVVVGVWVVNKRIFPLFNSEISLSVKFGQLLNYSWPLFLTGILNLVVGWTDTFMLGYFSSSANVGVYNAALPTSRLMLLLIKSVSIIFLPLATEAFSRGEHERMERIFTTSYRWVFLATLPVYLFLALFAQPIIVLMFGSSYVAGSTVLVVLATGFFLSTLSGPAQKLFNSVGRTRLVLGLTFSTALANLVLNYVLVPRFGIMGAAIATATSLGLGSLLNLVFLYRITSLFPLNLFFLRPLFVGLASVGGLYLFEKLLPLKISVWFIPLEVVLALALYGIGLYLTDSLKDEDKDMVVAVLGAIRQKMGG